MPSHQAYASRNPPVESAPTSGIVHILRSRRARHCLDQHRLTACTENSIRAAPHHLPRQSFVQRPQNRSGTVCWRFPCRFDGRRLRRGISVYGANCGRFAFCLTRPAKHSRSAQSRRPRGAGIFDIDTCCNACRAPLRVRGGSRSGQYCVLLWLYRHDRFRLCRRVGGRRFL